MTCLFFITIWLDKANRVLEYVGLQLGHVEVNHVDPTNSANPNAGEIRSCIPEITERKPRKETKIKTEKQLNQVDLPKVNQITKRFDLKNLKPRTPKTTTQPFNEFTQAY
jgi:hypothetical protein